MKLANRVPSRVKLIKCVFEQAGVEQQELKSFKGFRNNIIKKCAHKLFKSQPRVFLERRKDVSGDTPAKSRANSGNDSISDNKSLSISPFLENFLGWIMSFSAVALLATTTNNQASPSPTTVSTFRNQDNLLSEGIPIEIGLDEGQRENTLMEAESTENKEGVYNEDKLVGPRKKLEVHSEDTCPTAVLPKVEQVIENDENYISSHSSEDDPFADCEEEFQKENIISNRITLPNNDEPLEVTVDPDSKQELLKENGYPPEIKPGAPEIRQEPMALTLETHVREDGLNADSSSTSALRFHKTSTSHQMKHHLSKQDEIPEKSNAAAQNEKLPGSNNSNNSNNVTVVNQEENQLQGQNLSYNLRQKRKRSYQQAEMDEEISDEKNDNSDNSDREFINEDESSSSSSDSDTSIKCKTEEEKHDQVEKKQLNCRGNRSTIKSYTEELPVTEIKITTSKPTGRNGNNMRCKICNMRILKFQQEIHFSNYHDTKDIEKVLKCEAENCSAYFKTSSQRYIHMSKEHTAKTVESLKNQQGKFKCNFCDVVQENAIDFAIHEAEHAMREVEAHSSKTTTLKKFNCARCPYGSAFKKKYITHHLEKHLKLSATVTRNTCPICGVESSSGGEEFHKIHFQNQHNTEGMDPNEIQRCDQCQAYFVRSEQLIMHKYAVHYNRKCPVCGKVFARGPNKFRLHIDQHHPLFNAFPHLNYSCDIKSCTKRFGTERELSHHKIHERHYEDQVIKCTKCDKEFKGEKKLRAHMYHSHSSQTYICSECGKTFKNKCKLENHLRYHKAPEEWNFQCSTCGKKCVDKYKLTEHQRTHSKEKPFVCQVCGEKYAHRHNWLGHMRTKHKEEFSELKDGSRKSANFVSRKGTKKGECIISGVNQG